MSPPNTTLELLSQAGHPAYLDGATLRLKGKAPAELLALARTHKAELVEALTPRRLWLIRHADGSLASHSMTPPATLAEVAAWYPDATIEPEEPAGGHQCFTDS